MKQVQVFPEIQKLHEDLGFHVKSGDNWQLKNDVSADFILLFQSLRTAFFQASCTGMEQYHGITTAAKSRRDLVLQLRSRTEAVFQPIARSYIEQAKNHPENSEIYERLRESMHRIVQVFNRQMPEANTKEAQMDAVVHAVLQFGITNVAHQIWRLIEVIPRICQKLDVELTDKTYETLACSTYPLVVQMAVCNDTIFHVLKACLIEGYDGTESDKWAVLSNDLLSIQDQRIVFDPGLYTIARLVLADMQQNKRLDTKDHSWNGCIAIPLFKPIFNHCIHAAKQEVCNNAHSILALPLEHEQAMIDLGAEN